MGVTITGLNELIASFESAGEDVKPIIRKGLRAGAQVFQTAITERTPVRPNLPSGTALPVGALKTDIAIHTSSVKNNDMALVIAPDKMSRWEAQLVEYGHRQVTGGKSRESKKHPGKYMGPGKFVKDIPPHAFIRPAFEAAEPAAEVAITETIAAGITKKMGSK